MMNRRENFLRFIHHQQHDHVPFTGDECGVGGNMEIFENGPVGGGLDEFGCKWVATTSAMGQGVPAPNWVVCPDVTEWKKYVHFPDPSAVDWKAQVDSEMQYKAFDPENQVLSYGCWNGQFLRLMHLMGFENGLVSMALEPEACTELLTAITDYRISTLEYIKKYYNPDTVTLYDDVASSDNMFMQPSVYKEMIAPQHKRFFDAVRDLDMIPSLHICGKCESIIPWISEEDTEMWEICEVTNDILALQKQVGDKIAFYGGYPLNGIFSYTDPTEEELRKSVRDTIDLYGPGGNYGFFGLIMYEDLQRTFGTFALLNDEAAKYGTNFYVDGRAEEAAAKYAGTDTFNIWGGPGCK